MNRRLFVAAFLAACHSSSPSAESSSVVPPAPEAAVPAPPLEPTVTAPPPIKTPVTEPSVAWNSATSTYDLAGFPAISNDGTMLLFALVDGDAQGATSLTVVREGAHGGNAGDGVSTPKIDGPKRAPTAESLASVVRYLKDGQANYHWAPLPWHAVALRADGGGNGTAATVDGFAVSLSPSGSETKLTLMKDRRLLTTIDLVHDLETGVQSGSRPKCGKAPHLSGIGIDAAHQLAVISIAQMGGDGCFLSEVYAIHGWR